MTRRLRLPTALALVWLFAVSAGTLGAPWLAPADPRAVAADRSLMAPGTGQWLGTDLYGRDQLSRMLWGGRNTLVAAMAALGLTVLIGLPVGVVAALVGGALDEWAMRAADALMAIPGLLMALGIVAVLGPGLGQIALAVGAAEAPAFSRMARAATLQVREQGYVLAAQALGMTRRQLLIRHVIPNIAGPVLTLVTLHFAWAILNTSALTFLGLGLPPATPEWGAMLNDGRAYLRDAPWLALAPGLAITLTVMAVNEVGDWRAEAGG